MALLTRASHFRWRKPTASLKRELCTRCSGDSGHFRWRKPTASLKRELSTARRHLGSNFRWRKPTASLKLPRLQATGDAGSLFPLAKADGLIEATLTAAWQRSLEQISVGESRRPH